MNFRDYRFDALKGLATLVVVFGHVMQFGTKGYESTSLFNAIWSIQIPLFMIVSGYFSIHMHEQQLKDFLRQTFHYIWPCVTFYFIVWVIWPIGNPFRGMINLAWQIEGTLWYLLVLAVLNAFNYIASKVSNMLGGKYKQLIYFMTFFGEVLIYSLPGIKYGVRFVGIKFILYYSLFYWMGHMWHFINNLTHRKNLFKGCYLDWGGQ